MSLNVIHVDCHKSDKIIQCPYFLFTQTVIETVLELENVIHTLKILTFHGSRWLT